MKSLRVFEEVILWHTLIYFESLRVMLFERTMVHQIEGSPVFPSERGEVSAWASFGTCQDLYWTSIFDIRHSEEL